MESLAAGTFQRASANLLFLQVDMKDFSFKVGVKNQIWMESLKGGNPKQVFVHVFLSHVDPNNQKDPMVLSPKFAKLCNHFESYLKDAIFEAHKAFLDESTTLAAFWETPEDHTKLKKPDEKVRNLSKSLFRFLSDKHLPANLGEYRQMVEAVRSQKEVFAGDSFIAEMGDERGEFTTKPFVTFIRTFAPLAKKYPSLYERKHTFKVHPNGTVTFDMDQLSSLLLQKTRKDEPLKILRETFKESQRNVRELLNSQDFTSVAVLAEFLEVLATLIEKLERNPEGPRDVTKLRDYVSFHPDFPEEFPNIYTAELAVLLDLEHPDVQKIVLPQHGGTHASRKQSDEASFIATFPHGGDYASFFQEEEDT